MSWRQWKVSKITFAESAWEDYIYWQTYDKKVLKKINALLKEISRTPFEGTGKPEPLKGDTENWSRRINGVDRLVYAVKEDMIIVKQCKGHYDDH